MDYISFESFWLGRHCSEFWSIVLCCAIQISWSQCYVLWVVVAMEAISYTHFFLIQITVTTNSFWSNDSFLYIIWMVGVEVVVLSSEG